MNDLTFPRGLAALRAAPRGLLPNAAGADLDQIGQLAASLSRDLPAFMQRHDDVLDDVLAKIAALQVGGGAGGGGGGRVLSAAAREHAHAFEGFFRKGLEADLRGLELKAALRTDSDPDGGYVAPEAVDNAVDRVLGTLSPMRRIAQVLQVSAGTYKKLVSQGGASSGWVGERESRPETNTPTLAELAFPVMELYANPAATQTVLDDARIDIAEWLAGEVAIEFAEEEGAAFVSGNGVNRPRGILSYDTVANASWSWGKLGYVATGEAADLKAEDPGDQLIDLQTALHAGYRGNASWLMNGQTLSKVRKFKDDQDNYLLMPGIVAGAPDRLLGSPIVVDDNMPDVAENAFPIAYGDFRRGYLIVDRIGVRVLRDPYTNKPFVHFYTTKRVGAGVQNFQAIKLLKVATS